MSDRCASRSHGTTTTSEATGPGALAAVAGPDRDPATADGSRRFPATRRLRQRLGLSLRSSFIRASGFRSTKSISGLSVLAPVPCPVFLPLFLALHPRGLVRAWGGRLEHCAQLVRGLAQNIDVVVAVCIHLPHTPEKASRRRLHQRVPHGRVRRGLCAFNSRQDREPWTRSDLGYGDSPPPLVPLLRTLQVP